MSLSHPRVKQIYALTPDLAELQPACLAAPADVVQLHHHPLVVELEVLTGYRAVLLQCAEELAPALRHPRPIRASYRARVRRRLRTRSRNPPFGGAEIPRSQAAKIECTSSTFSDATYSVRLSNSINWEGGGVDLLERGATTNSRLKRLDALAVNAPKLVSCGQLAFLGRRQ